MVPPALEAQSLNHWTTGEVPCGQFLFVLIAALPTSFTRGVALSGVPSGAGWLHLATKEFPDCPPAFFFLFWGICFFSSGQLKSLSSYLEFYGFPKASPGMDFFPSALWLLGQWTPVWTRPGKLQLTQSASLLPAGMSSAGPVLEASCHFLAWTISFLLSRPLAFWDDGWFTQVRLWFRLGHVFC